jgi:hypothetical protein
MMQVRSKAVRCAVAVACAWALLSCAGARRADVNYHDGAMDFSLIRSVAVMPFDNLTTEANAGGRVRDTFSTMLQATGAMYVLPPGEVNRAILRTSPADPSAPSSEEVIALANVTGVDAIVTGVVREYGQVRTGSSTGNVISIGIEMMESQTGRVIWSASSTQGGIKLSNRMFGGGGRPMDVVTTEAVRDLLDQLFDVE